MVFDISLTMEDVPRSTEDGVARQAFKEEMSRGVKSGQDAMKAVLFKTTPLNTGLTRQGWTTKPLIFEDRAVIGPVSNEGSSGLVAIILEGGAKPHFPPVPQEPDGEPALGTWLRRARDFEPYVIKKDGSRRPMNPFNINDVRKAAFAISSTISKRGFPRSGVPLGGFQKSLEAIEPALRAALDRAVANLIRRWSE